MNRVMFYTFEERLDFTTAAGLDPDGHHMEATLAFGEALRGQDRESIADETFETIREVVQAAVPQLDNQEEA